MTALATLLAFAAAMAAAGAGYLVAAWGAARSPVNNRYAIWSLGFWSGPLVGALTIAAVATHAVGQSDSPPAAMMRMARSADHRLLGFGVVSALAILGVVAVVKLMRLAKATAQVRTMIRRARTKCCAYSLREDVGERPRTTVLLSDDVRVPVLAGILKPVVLLPGDAPVRFTRQQIALICEHEFTHARRGDNLRLWLEEAAAAIFWWSPATILARRRLGHAREASCDAIVLERSDDRQRAAYASTLLQVLGHRQLLMTAYSSGDGAEMAQRIRLLLAPHAQPKSHLATMVALAVLLTTGAMTPVLAGRTIDQAGLSFALSAPIDISFRRTGAVDARTGRPLYRITYERPTGAGETLLGLPLAQQTGTVDVRRRKSGGWWLRTG